MFAFSFKKPTRDLPEEFTPGELEDVEDYEYLIVCACSVLAETDAEFHIGGFGLDDWGFNVETDMSAFLEDFPNLFKGLRDGNPVTLPLYQQGVERNLTFKRSGEKISILCESRTSWVPNPELETLDYGQLLMMLQQLTQGFAEALAEKAPEIACLAPFPLWRAGRAVVEAA
ncbi:hypothetical protein ACWGLE_22840 [Streptomyces sp. NPDC055897]